MTRQNKAHMDVMIALRTGKLTKQVCEKCGDANTVAHHEDYDFPLQVNWLCRLCHKHRHMEMKLGSFVEGKKRFPLALSPELNSRVKMAAFAAGQSMSDWIREAIQEGLDATGRAA